jgi:hypothetical protein
MLFTAPIASESENAAADGSSTDADVQATIIPTTTATNVIKMSFMAYP